MKTRAHRWWPIPIRSLAPALAALTIAAGVAHPENIDPDNDGSQHAYGENVGWLNAEPNGDGLDGIEVGDTGLTGWMWGENVGWVSVSCQNTGSCGTTDYGVTNDGGTLAGYAWGENIGWISFSCSNTASCADAAYGVSIDPVSGLFSGRAWGENVGWISFSSNGPVPYQVRTAWTCAAPVGVSLLLVDPSTPGTHRVRWSPLPGATTYDLIRGDLFQLRSSSGDFSAAVSDCLGDNQGGLTHISATSPATGQGWFYLVRGTACLVSTYDSDVGSQVAPRDATISASSAACP